MYETFNPYYRQNTFNPGINWVKGCEQVKSITLPFNSSGIFLDQDNDGIFYIKATDNSGMSSVRTFKFEEIFPDNKQFDDSQFVKKDEIEITVANILNKLLGGNDNGEQSVSTVKSSS